MRKYHFPWVSISSTQLFHYFLVLARLENHIIIIRMTLTGLYCWLCRLESSQFILTIPLKELRVWKWRNFGLNLWLNNCLWNTKSRIPRFDPCLYNLHYVCTWGRKRRKIGREKKMILEEYIFYMFGLHKKEMRK